MSVLMRPSGAVTVLASPYETTLPPFRVCQRGVTALRMELGLLPVSLLLPLAPGPLRARCTCCCCSVYLCVTYPTGGGTESWELVASGAWHAPCAFSCSVCTGPNPDLPELNPWGYAGSPFSVSMGDVVLALLGKKHKRKITRIR